MRILIISNVPWDDRNSLGNTLSNWFDGWDDTIFYNVYCRMAAPANHVCYNYYTVPPLNLMKNLFRPSKIGWGFVCQDGKTFVSDNSETSLINNAQQGKKEWMYMVADFAYATGIWKTKQYRRFIAEVNPDIVFSFGIADSFIYENYCYIKKHTCAKIVTFVADDVYGAYTDGKTIRSRLMARRFRKMMCMSDKVYGASEQLCEAYQNIFNINMTPLYKGCVLLQTREKVGEPLRLVYAGNLLWGRDVILVKIADALVKLNAQRIIATLEIYTGSFLNSEIKERLNRGDSSRVVGRKSYEEIVEILHGADFALHVESFDEKAMKTVRYSFSTKITDCIQAGVPMMVVGPRGIASVEYSRKIPGVIVIDNLDEIQKQITRLVDGREELMERVAGINAFAKKYHSLETIRNSLKADFLTLSNR